MAKHMASPWSKAALTLAALSLAPRADAQGFFQCFGNGGVPLAPSDLTLLEVPKPGPVITEDDAPPPSSVISLDPNKFSTTVLVGHGAPDTGANLGIFKITNNQSDPPDPFTISFAKLAEAYRSPGAPDPPDFVNIGDTNGANDFSGDAFLVADGAGKIFTIVLKQGVVSTLGPGKYRETITINRGVSPTLEDIGTIYVYLTIVPVFNMYTIGFISPVEANGMHVVIKARTSDNKDFNAALSFKENPDDPDLKPTIIPLFRGNDAAANSGYNLTSTTGDNANVNVDLYLDDAQPTRVSSAYDRDIPAVAGRWAPSSDESTLTLINPDVNVGLDTFVAAPAGGRFTFYFFNDSGSTNPDFEIVEACLLAGTEVEGDLNPRGSSLGGPGLRGVLNISDQIYAGFHLLGFDFVDTRIKAPFNSGNPNEVLPQDLVHNIDPLKPDPINTGNRQPELSGTYTEVAGRGNLNITITALGPNQISFSATNTFTGVTGNFVQTAVTPNIPPPPAAPVFPTDPAPVDIGSVAPGLFLDFLDIDESVSPAAEPLGYMVGDKFIVGLRPLLLNIRDISNVFQTLARGFDPFAVSPVVNFRRSLQLSDGTEFSRLDVAPVSSGGDGVVTVADFVQIGRYIAGAGFDDRSDEKGPLGSGDRIVRLGNPDNSAERLTIQRGQTARIPIVLRSKGVEQTLSLGLKFDPTLLEFVSAEKPVRVLNPFNDPVPTFDVMNSAIDQGLLGLEIGLRPNHPFPLQVPDGSSGMDFALNPASAIVGPSQTGAGVNYDTVVAFVTFRALAGSGTANTEIQFVQSADGGGPLGPRASTVRLQADYVLPATFVASGITVLDASAAQPIIRVPNTVISQNTTGDVDIILDAVGIESGTAFAVEFNKTDLDILSVKPGRDLPGDAFFLSNPDFFDDGTNTAALEADFSAKAEEAGKFNVLIALQPGETLPAGKNIIATLHVRTRPLLDTTTVRSELKFLPIGRNLDVVDVKGIPIASQFRNPSVYDERQVIIVPGNCVYNVSVASVSGGSTVTSPTSVSVPLTGGNGTVAVDTDAVCDWNASVDQSWVTLSSTGTTSGPGSVNFTVAPLSGVGPRFATITVVDKQIIITQAGCALLSATPNIIGVTGLGGAGSFFLDVASQTCNWIVSSNNSFIHITTAGAGTGDATISFTVDPGTGTPRIGSITVTQPGTGGTVLVVRVYQDFDFIQDAEGWTFGSAVPALSEPNHSISLNPSEGVGGTFRLDLTTTNNVDNFGFWGSPLFTLASPSAAGSVYRASMRVTTDAAASQVPAFRLRASPVDFAQTAEFTVSSVGSSPAFVPDTNGRTYQHFFNLPDGSTQFHIYFDVINASPDDAAVARVSLESIALTKIGTLTGGISEGAAIVPKNNPSDWVPVTATPTFAAPIFTTDARGISIRHAQTDPNVAGRSFGFYDYLSNVTVQAGRLYRFDFTVSARDERTTNIRKSVVPTFRLRLNDASFQSATLLQIESITDSSRIPTFLQNQVYTVWYLGDSAIAGQKLHVAFDYLYDPSSFNDPGIALILEQLNVTSFDAP
ncbi:hypothetical protein BH09SUM1_BH09SUM1_25580 [soil metagenome]